MLRRVFWLSWACLLILAPHAHASSRLLTADFDGDGRGDWVAIDGRHPSVVHIWLSASKTATQIRSRRPVLQIAARDVDGDHLPELITAEGSNGGRHHRSSPTRLLRVWRQDARRGFYTYHPRPPTPRAARASSRQAIDREQPVDDCAAFGSFLHLQDSAAARVPAGAPDPSIAALSIRIVDVTPASYVPFDPSGPRAPPVPTFPISRAPSRSSVVRR